MIIDETIIRMDESTSLPYRVQTRPQTSIIMYIDKKRFPNLYKVCGLIQNN